MFSAHSGLESRKILKEGAVKHLRTGGGVIAVEPHGEVQSDKIPVTAPGLPFIIINHAGP